PFRGIADQHSLAGADDQRSNHKDRYGPQCSVWLGGAAGRPAYRPGVRVYQIKPTTSANNATAIPMSTHMKTAHPPNPGGGCFAISSNSAAIFSMPGSSNSSGSPARSFAPA